MATAMDVFPRRNLPGEAEEWGRRMEEVTRDLYKTQVQTQQALRNEGRATGGQLAVISKQIDAVYRQQEELLLGRRTYTQSVSDVSLVATTPGLYPVFTRSFNLEPPYLSPRSTTMSVSANFARTSATGNMTVWVELLRGTSVIWRRTGAVFVGDTASAPAAWGNPGFSDSFQVTTPTNEDTYTLRFYAHTFVAETVTVQVSGINVVASYGDPV